MRYNPPWQNGLPIGTLCTYCQNAVPSPRKRKGCSWSVDFAPVDGWKAISVTRHLSYKNEPFETYCVVKCPLFDEERYREHEGAAAYYDLLVPDEDDGVAV